MSRPGAAAGAELLALLTKGSAAGAPPVMAASAPGPPGLPASSNMHYGEASAGARGSDGNMGGAALASRMAQALHIGSSSTGAAFGSDSSGAAPSLGNYGLLGLLMQLRGDSSAPPLSLGADIATLGLNLTSPEPLHPTFAYPWGDSPVTREPAFSLPACYKMPQPALKTGHLARFEPATLFYIFYGMPRDVLQAYAAQELYARGWRYHAELKTWFRHETLPLPPGDAAKTTPLQVGFVYWDASAWEKRIYGGAAPPATLAASFLSEDEVQVRQPVAQPQPRA